MRPVNIQNHQLKDHDIKRSLFLAPIEFSPLRQISRINVSVDDISEAQTLTASNDAIRPFDIVSASPGTASTFAYLCKTADIDIIALDFTHKIPFPINKKQVTVLTLIPYFFPSLHLMRSWTRP